MDTSIIKGRFITVEGVEGAGKSTIVNFIHEQLLANDIPCVVTREPGGTPIAEEIRQILLNKHDEMMCPDTEVLLMFAGRAQHISQVILPALQRGQWVISDRFTDASFAYQGGGRGVSLAHIRELAAWVQGDLQPDCTVLMDLPIDVAFSRLNSRGAMDRIESEGVAFFERVRDRYLIRARKYPERFRVVNADQALEMVKQDVLKALQPLLEEIHA